GGVPSIAVDLIAKSLALDPAQRFQNARAFGDQLANAIAGTSTAALASETERVLDVAAAGQTPIHKPAEVISQIRRTSSGGLAAILETDRDYSAAKEDVRSKPFCLEFPRDARGVPKPLDLTLRIECPDFEPASAAKTIRVPVDRDSDV